MSEEKGAAKTLGERVVRTVHMFHAPYGKNGPEGPAIVQTVHGDFLYMNGNMVDNREHLEYIPEQYRAMALAWFDKKHGHGAVAPVQTPEGISTAANPTTESMLMEIYGMVKDLRHEMNVIRGIEPPDPKMVEEARAAIAEQEQPKPGSPRGARRKSEERAEEPDILTQVGVV